MDLTGSGLCSIAVFGISDVASCGSAASKFVNQQDTSLGTQAVRMGGGWNWLRIVFSGGLCY